jgi:hypothetical protein
MRRICSLYGVCMLLTAALAWGAPFTGRAAVTGLGSGSGHANVRPSRHKKVTRPSRHKKVTTRRQRAIAQGPRAGDPVLFGDQAVESALDEDVAGLPEAFPFTNSTSGTASSVVVYVDAENQATKLLTGLYSNNNGSPGALLATGSLASPKPGAWNSVTIHFTAIEPGTYWLAILGKGGTLYFRDRSNGPCFSENTSRGRFSQPPSPWPAGPTWNTCPISAYVGGTRTSSGSSPPPIVAPANTAPPTLTGSDVQGDTLSTSTGAWSGSPTSYSYSWQDCDSSGNHCTDISQASAPTYSLTGNDVGHTIRAVVTARNEVGSASASTGPSAVVTPLPPSNTALPAITGTPTPGQTLSSSTGSWTGSPTEYSYQWEDCDSSGSNCSDISNATASSYALGSADVGDTIRAVVTATNGGGSTSATSAATVVVGSSSTGGGAGLDFALDPDFIGPSYYSKFSNGPSSSMTYFPICTYQTNLFQNDVSVANMVKAGINCADMAYDGGNQADLNIAAANGMWENINGSVSSFTSNQSDVKAYAMLDAPEEENDPYNPSNGCTATTTPSGTIANPSPDNCAQAYINDANGYRSTDPTRPVWGNFSTGVEAYAFPPSGWTSQQWQLHMASMLQADDIDSGDAYFWTSQYEYSQANASQGSFGTGNEGAWGYGRVVDRERYLSDYTRPTYDIVECCDSGDGNGSTEPTNEMTPNMIETGVWDALVHGARGIDWWTTDSWDSSSGGDPDDQPYDNSNGEPATYYDDQAVYADAQWAPQLAAMEKVDGEIDSYAVDLNSPTVLGASATDDDGSVPVSTLAKDVGGKLWLVAMADGNNTYPMSNQTPMTATVSVPSAVPVGTVLNVVGENRTVTVNANHQFTDTFGTTTDGPGDLYCGCSLTYGYQHHIYAMP